MLDLVMSCYVMLFHVRSGYYRLSLVGSG